MKKTLAKICGIAMVIAVLASMLIASVPAGALTITEVSLTSTNISATSTYTVSFTGSLDLTPGTDTVTVTLPYDTDISGVTVASVSFDGGNGTLVPATAGTITPAARIVQITVPATAAPCTIGKKWRINIVGVVNPTTPGSYSLSVATSQEPAGVTSAAYTIGVPVQVMRYNKAGNFVGSYNTIQGALDVANDDDTIKLGAGTYAESPTVGDDSTTPAPLDRLVDRVTITSVGTAADTIIAMPPGPPATLTIGAGCTYITIDDITINGVVKNDAANTTIKNCVINFPGGPATQTLLTSTAASLTVDTCAFDTTAAGNTSADVAIDISGAGAPPGSTIKNSTFKLNQSSALAQDVAVKATGVAGTFTVTGCTFTGSSGVGYTDVAGADATFSKNTFTKLASAAILSTGSTFKFDSNTVDGCTDATPAGGAIVVQTVAPASLTVVNNIIKNGAGYSMNIQITPTLYAITGNQFSNNAKGFRNTAGVTAKLNWWGAAGGPGSTGADVVSSDSAGPPDNYKPFLTVAPTAAATNMTAAAVALALPPGSEASVGVLINGYTAPVGGAFISAQKLSANPQTILPPFPVLSYFDVFTSAASTTVPVQINFYTSGIDNTTQVYVWSGARGDWVLCSNQGVSGTGTYVWVSLTATSTPSVNDLTGTPFAVVSGLAPAPAAFDVISPANGTSLTSGSNVPFAWKAVVGATTYSMYVYDASGAEVVKKENISGTAYVHAGALSAGAYTWRVDAYQNNAVIGKAYGAFVIAAPATTAPVSTVVTTFTLPQPTTVTYTLPQQTTVTISTPPVEEITPTWIWVLIGIGAVLIIVVIVLIVRTRRTS